MIDHNETVLTKTVAMPADTKPNGDIFGGWLLSQMDVAGGILAKKIAKRVIVKRPRHAVYLAEQHPDHQWLGDACRFDAYFPKG